MAEKVVIELEVDSSGSNKGVGNLKQQLREATNDAQRLAEKFGATSNEAVKAAQRAAILREEIADVRQTINALNPEAKFNAIVSVGQGIAGGFAAAQGAMALFGAESENVQKALLKVQAAMAISQGLNEINGLRDGFNNLSIVIKNSTIYTKAAAIVQGTYNFVVGASTTAMKLFRLALVSTGIGAFVVALGTLVAYWGDLTKYVKENTEQVKKWGAIFYGIISPPLGMVMLLWKGFVTLGEKIEFVGNITDAISDKFSYFKDKIVELLEQVGLLNTAEEDAAETRMEASKQKEFQIKREIELAKAQGASAQELAALEVKLAREKLLAYDQYIKARISSGRTLTDDEKEQLSQLGHELKLAKLAEQKVIEDANKKQLDENRKKWEAKKKQDEENKKREEDLQRELQDLTIANIKDERERELKELQISFERKIAAIKGNSETEIAIRTQLAEQQRTQEGILRDRYLQEDLQKEVEELQLKFENKNAELEAQKITQEIADQETALIEAEQALLKFNKEQADEALSREQKLLSKANYEKALSDIEKRESEKRLANAKKIEEAKYSVANSTIKGLGSLTEIFIKNGKKQEAASKALAVAQLAIDTAKAISSTIANATQAASAGGPAAPFLAAGYIASGIATVLANVSQAKKLLGGSGPDVGAAAGGSVGGSSAQSQVGDVVNAPRLRSTDGAVTQLSPEEKQFNVTVNAQVIETDMTDSQKRVSTLKDKAQI